MVNVVGNIAPSLGRSNLLLYLISGLIKIYSCQKEFAIATRLDEAIEEDVTATGGARCLAVDDVTAAYVPSSGECFGAAAFQNGGIEMNHSVTTQLRGHVNLGLAAAALLCSPCDWVRYSVTTTVVLARDELTAAVCTSQSIFGTHCVTTVTCRRVCT